MARPLVERDRMEMETEELRHCQVHVGIVAVQIIKLVSVRSSSANNFRDSATTVATLVTVPDIAKCQRRARARAWIAWVMNSARNAMDAVRTMMRRNMT